MSTFQQIDAEQVSELVKKGGVTIVDIRDPQVYEEAHISGAVSVTPENIDEFLQSADRAQPLLCYCYHGVSSQSAADYFSQNGFKEVYSMIGGFEEWRKSYPTISGQG